MAGVLIAAAVMGTSACGGEAAAQKKPAKKPMVSVQAAAREFQDAVELSGCEDVAPGTCWDQMEALTRLARTLRTAMNADKSVGAEFWTDAYALIDTMEEGIDVGEDLGGVAEGESIDAAGERSNRDEVLGSANRLSDWLDAHPVK